MPLNKERALEVKVGDRLRMNPLWNNTTRFPHFDEYVKVRRIATGQISQTSVLFMVKDENGRDHWLDAGWFMQ